LNLFEENILIKNGMNGRFVKLYYFGLATFHEFDDQSHSSKTSSLKYIASEVMRGRKYDKENGKKVILGFGNKNRINELILNEELSYKQIIYFINSSYHVIARNINGKVYF
jgi:hypothetical protein